MSLSGRGGGAAPAGRFIALWFLIAALLAFPLFSQSDSAQNTSSSASNQSKQSKKGTSTASSSEEPKLSAADEAALAAMFPSYPTLHALFFASGTFVSEHHTGTNGRTSTTSGGADLVLTSQLSDNFSALGQFSLRSTEGESTLTRIEQLQLRFARSNEFQLRLGKFHTPVGYWNETYHDIGWLRTSIFRPEMFRYEKDGGIMPVHTIGVQAAGKVGFRPMEFGYSFTFGKGRGPKITDETKFNDLTSPHAFTAQFTFVPNRFRGFKLGINGYADTIPADPTTPGRNGTIGERIYGGFVAWHLLNLEILGEYDQIRHNDSVSGLTYKSDGYYWQVASQFYNWRIYERTDVINFDPSDPYFLTIDHRDLIKFTIGVRWDPTRWLGIKGEYSYSDRNRQPNSNSVNFQAAVFF